MELSRRTGFEVELLAPPGADRRLLAERIAHAHDGRVDTVWHSDSEPSMVPGMGTFWHLTPGFAVSGSGGEPLATLVDDITIVADLDRRAASRPGWYRLLSDEPRLLRLIAATTDPAATLDEVLEPVAALFGVEVEHLGAVRRVQDATGATIVLAAPLVSDRHRPCEVVTPPLERDHERALEDLLRPARDLGFTVPAEAAVHLHLDGAPFRNVPAFANLVRLFGYWREPLRRALGTNPRCTRLQALPPELLDLVERRWPDRDGTNGWSALQEAAAGTGLTKYFDVNLTALLTDAPARDTVEVRTLPGAARARDITDRALLLEGLLDRCLSPVPLPRPSGTDPVRSAGELRELSRQR